MLRAQKKERTEMKTIRFALLLALAALLTLGAVGCKKQSASVEGSL